MPQRRAVGSAKRAASAAVKGTRALTTTGTKTSRMRSTTAGPTAPPTSIPTGMPNAPWPDPSQGRKKRTTPMAAGGGFPMQGMRPGAFQPGFAGNGMAMPGQQRGMSSQARPMGQQGSNIFNALPNRGQFAQQQPGVFNQLPNGGRFASTQAVQGKMKRTKSTSDMYSAGKTPPFPGGVPAGSTPQVVVQNFVDTGKGHKKGKKDRREEGMDGGRLGMERDHLGGKIKRRRSMNDMNNGLDHRGQQPLPPSSHMRRRAFSTGAAEYPGGPYQSRGEEGFEDEHGGAGGGFGEQSMSRRGAAASAVGGAARHALDSAKEAGGARLEKMFRSAMESGHMELKEKKLKRLKDGKSWIQVERGPNPDGTPSQPLALPLPPGLLASIRSGASGVLDIGGLLSNMAGVVWEHRNMWGPVALSAITLAGPKGVALKLALNMLMK